MKNVLVLLLTLFLSLVVIGCGGGEVKTDVNILGTVISDIGVLSHKIDVPKMPDDEASKKTVTGVDKNNNSIRDDLEQIAYQSLNSIETINESSYNNVLSIMKMIQPKNPPVAKSINKHAIYCQYRLLPDDVKDELSLSFLYSIVLDSKDRKNAFNDSLEPSTSSLGAESCE